MTSSFFIWIWIRKEIRQFARSIKELSLIVWSIAYLYVYNRREIWFWLNDELVAKRKNWDISKNGRAIIDHSAMYIVHVHVEYVYSVNCKLYTVQYREVYSHKVENRITRFFKHITISLSMHHKSNFTLPLLIQLQLWHLLRYAKLQPSDGRRWNALNGMRRKHFYILRSRDEYWIFVRDQKRNRKRRRMKTNSKKLSEICFFFFFYKPCMIKWIKIAVVTPW